MVGEDVHLRLISAHCAHMRMLWVVDGAELFAASRDVCGKLVLYLGQLRTAVSSLSHHFKTCMHLSLSWIISLVTLAPTEAQSVLAKMSGASHLVETHKRFKSFSSGGRLKYHCYSHDLWIIFKFLPNTESMSTLGLDVV